MMDIVQIAAEGLYRKYMAKLSSYLGKNMIMVMRGNSWQTTEINAAQTGPDFKMGIHGTSLSVLFFPTSSQLFDRVMNLNSSLEIQLYKNLNWAPF